MVGWLKSVKALKRRTDIKEKSAKGGIKQNKGEREKKQKQQKKNKNKKYKEILCTCA